MCKDRTSALGASELIELEPQRLHIPFSVPCAECRQLVPAGVRGGLLLVNREDDVWFYFCPDCASRLRRSWSGQMECSGCTAEISYDEVGIISLWNEQQQACATCVECARFDTESDPPE